MIYVTSDTHFFHKNLVNWGDRKEGFENDVLESWEDIPHHSTLIHLGDVMMGRELGFSERDSMVNCLSVLESSVTKILIRGNHDKESTRKYLELGWDLVVDELTMTYNGHKILFTHRPEEDESRYDINIHGHHHGKYGFVNKYVHCTRVDVSVDNTDMKPMTLDKILELTYGRS